MLTFQGTLNGAPATLHFGGDNDGWFVDSASKRIRQATEEEKEFTRRWFWKESPAAGGAGGPSDIEPPVSG